MRRSARSAPASPSPRGRSGIRSTSYLLFSDMPADVRRRWDAARRRRRSAPAVEQMQRHDLRRRAQPDRVRARDLEPRARAAGRAARGARVAFRGTGAQQPQRCLRALRRLDLFLRSLVWPHAGLRRRAAAPARLPGRLSRAAGRRRAAIAGRPHLFDQPNGLCFSPDEKLLYVNDTVQPLIRVFDVDADGSLSNGRIFASGIRSALEPGVPDGMKCDAARQCLGDRAGRGLGLCAVAATCSARCACPSSSPISPGAGRTSARLFMTATHSVYAVKTKVGPRREPYMSARTRRDRSRRRPDRAPSSARRRAAGLTLDPRRCALIIQDMQNDVIMEGGAFAASGSPAHARAAERGRERAPPRRRGARPRRRR